MCEYSYMCHQWLQHIESCFSSTVIFVLLFLLVLILSCFCYRCHGLFFFVYRSICWLLFYFFAFQRLGCTEVAFFVPCAVKKLLIQMHSPPVTTLYSYLLAYLPIPYLLQDLPSFFMGNVKSTSDWMWSRNNDELLSWSCVSKTLLAFTAWTLNPTMTLTQWFDGGDFHSDMRGWTLQVPQLRNGARPEEWETLVPASRKVDHDCTVSANCRSHDQRRKAERVTSL